MTIFMQACTPGLDNKANSAGSHVQFSHLSLSPTVARSIVPSGQLDQFARFAQVTPQKEAEFVQFVQLSSIKCPTCKPGLLFVKHVPNSKAMDTLLVKMARSSLPTIKSTSNGRSTLYLDTLLKPPSGHPLHAWRLTPSSKAPPSTCPNLLNEWKDDSEDTFPLPEVISRFPGVSSPKSSATGKAPDSGLDINADTLSKPETQDERWLEPAMDWLMDALEKELEGSKDHPSGSAGVWPKNRGHAAVYWGLGSDHALGAAKIDWGLQCYSRRVEFCNG
eukprot:1144971-Pelagomonas_calceolata.AAC.4